MHFAKDVSPHSSSASYFFANSDPVVCAWLGRESLPCLSVRPAWHGPVLLISLCNGMGCAALALAAFGIHFSFVCVEPSSVFRQSVRASAMYCILLTCPHSNLSIYLTAGGSSVFGLFWWLAMPVVLARVQIVSIMHVELPMLVPRFGPVLVSGLFAKALVYR